MKKQFVTIEIAKQLKDLGFDEECLAIYDNQELSLCHPELEQDDDILFAPLWQQAWEFILRKGIDFDFILDLKAREERFLKAIEIIKKEIK